MKKLLLLAAIMLALPLMAQEEEEWRYTQGWITNLYFGYVELENVKAAPTPKTMLEAVDRMPAFPTVEQRKSCADYLSAVRKSTVCCLG